MAGLTYLVIAATSRLLPPDEHYLGLTAAQLEHFYGGRVVHFMVHDRVSFAGSILSVGLLYTWIGAVPLRAGEPWAFWTLVISGLVGFASFLTYLGYGYYDAWHGAATLVLLPIFLLGLIRSYRGLSRPRGPAALIRQRIRSWRWSPASRGRMALGFSAFGMIAGGITIMIVGMTQVFVPQDLEYMRVGRADLTAISSKLVSLIAHDRAGFGGGLCSGGLIIAAVLICGVRPRSPGLWWALLLAGLTGFGCAIGIHPVVGYNSFIHLLPAYAGALAFLVGIALLRKPMCRDTGPVDHFPDL